VKRRLASLAGPVLLLAVAACGATPVTRIHVDAIANQDEEPVPCAILVNQVLLTDASGEPIHTPATIPVTFEKDPSGAYPFLPATIGVVSLVDDRGKLRLPNDAASEAPKYRYAERQMRPSDSKKQLFILLRNLDEKVFRIPRARANVQ
jgi:hypothetical protein